MGRGGSGELDAGGRDDGWMDGWTDGWKRRLYHFKRATKRGLGLVGFGNPVVSLLLSCLVFNSGCIPIPACLPTCLLACLSGLVDGRVAGMK